MIRGRVQRRTLMLLLALSLLPSLGYAQRQGTGSVLQTLRGGNVYVDPRLQGQINAGTLQQAASPQVKIAVLAGLPNGPWRNINDYTGKLHQALKLGQGALIVVVPRNRQGGVGISVSSDALSGQSDFQLAKAAAPSIHADPVSGIVQLAQSVAASLTNAPVSGGGGNASTAAAVGSAGEQSRGHGGAILGLVFLIVVVVIVALIASAARRRKQSLSIARGPVEALQGNVLSGIEYIDHYSDVLPKNSPDSDVVRTARQAASDKYEQASQILAHAGSETDLTRAQGLLDRAQADIQQARGALDRALGGTKNIPGDDAFRPPPLPQSQQQVNAIPASQRAVSFFSGQPAPLGALVPVTLTVGGQPRQVYATPQEAEELRRGQMPQVRAFNVGGQYVPWYSYNAYDPYRDYWQYQNNGWGGFGSGALAGFVGAELLGDLMTPSYGYGYSPYAFSPDFSYTQGYDAGLANAQGYDAGLANGQMDNQFYDANNGGGFDNNNYGDPSGGGDFNNFGGGDTSGGGDFGGDFGGGDMSGGGDFGGGDMSGGGDF